MDMCAEEMLWDPNIEMLVTLVRDELGPGVPQAMFMEMMAALFRNIDSFQSEPYKQRQRYLAILWTKYIHVSRFVQVH
jgi:hypothetical protein